MTRRRSRHARSTMVEPTPMEPVAIPQGERPPSLSSPYRRIVVKLGSNLLTAGGERLDLETMASLVGQVARLHHQGKEVIVVTSGAMAAGSHELGIARERKDIPFRQVMAAVGQSLLMQAYNELFRWHDITVAQTLLTRADLSHRPSYLNARNTLLALLELRVVPIVNENDVVAVEEIQELHIGDNDNLSAMVANLVDADLLILLSDIAGLYTADPARDPQAQLIARVERIDGRIERLAGQPGSPFAQGGMVTKIQAARLATAFGAAVIIADGRERDVLLRLAGQEPRGTLFPPQTSKVESRKRWMLSGLSTKGQIVVDEGAAIALERLGKSLLPAGIVKVEGRFSRGDIVTIADANGRRLGCGITNYNSADLNTIKGHRSDSIVELLGYEYGAEVIHRNNLVILEEAATETPPAAS